MHICTINDHQNLKYLAIKDSSNDSKSTTIVVFGYYVIFGNLNSADINNFPFIQNQTDEIVKIIEKNELVPAAEIDNLNYWFIQLSYISKNVDNTAEIKIDK